MMEKFSKDISIDVKNHLSKINIQSMPISNLIKYNKLILNMVDDSDRIVRQYAWGRLLTSTKGIEKSIVEKAYEKILDFTIIDEYIDNTIIRSMLNIISYDIHFDVLSDLIKQLLLLPIKEEHNASVEIDLPVQKRLNSILSYAADTLKNNKNQLLQIFNIVMENNFY